MKRNNSIKSLEKAIAVLHCFTTNSLKLGAADIAKRVGIPIPTVYRILKTLVRGKLLSQDGKGKTYEIGPLLYMLGSLYLSTTDIVVAAEPVTKVLNEITSEAVNVSILNDGYITVILKEEPIHPFRWGVHVGRTSLAYTSSMGQAILADYSDVEIDRVYPEEYLKQETSKTISTKTALKQVLMEIKRNGVAINYGGYIQGINGIGAPIRDTNSKAVAAISISFPIFRTNQARVSSLATLVKMGARLISHRLGYRDSDPVQDINDLRSWWEQNKIDIPE